MKSTGTYNMLLVITCHDKETQTEDKIRNPCLLKAVGEYLSYYINGYLKYLNNVVTSLLK